MLICQFKKMNSSGQSLVEIVIAMSLMVLFIAAIAALALSGFSSQEYLSRVIQARALADEGIEALRYIAAEDFDSLVYDKSAVIVSGGEWRLEGENTTEQIGVFNRKIEFFPVYRDSGLNIAAAEYPGAVLDVNIKKARITLEWARAQAGVSRLARTVYLTGR